MDIPRGFTFIELLVVVIILGVLVAAVVPRYLVIPADSQQAAVSAVAAALSAASATNYGIRKASPNQGVSVANCQDTAALLPGGNLPAGYTITSSVVAADAETMCTVTRMSGGKTGTFTAIGIN